MTNQTNTSGGASIGGNVDTNEFVGRDKQTINNIVIVGRFLEFAQIEGLLPRLESEQDFASIAEAIEGNLAGRMDDDLAEAVAWVGEMLGEFFTEWIAENIPDNRDVPVPLIKLIRKLIVHLIQKLKANNYWGVYPTFRGDIVLDKNNEPVTITDVILWLEATSQLLNHKQPNSIDKIGIIERDTTHWSLEDHVDNFTPVYDLIIETSTVKNTAHKWLALEDLTRHQLRLIIAGIVLDLIRIKSDNTISVQFLKELADMVKPKQEQSK